MPAKRRDHVRRIDPVPGLRQDPENCAPVCNHGGLDTEIEEEGLEDGTHDGEGAGVSSDAGACEADDQAEDDGEEGDEAVGNVEGPERAEEHGGDAYEGEEADDQG